MDKLKWGMDWHLTAYLEGVWHLSLHLTCNGHSGTTKDDGWNLTLISHGHCPSDTVKWFHNSMLINFQRPISAQISGLVSKIRAPNRLNHKIIFCFFRKLNLTTTKKRMIGTKWLRFHFEVTNTFFYSFTKIPSNENKFKVYQKLNAFEELTAKKLVSFL